MQPLNLCRQMRRAFADKITIPSLKPELRDRMAHCVDLAAASQKFLLPPGGRLYDDKEYRALDETQPLRLPYPFIALEYAVTPDCWSAPVPRSQQSSKRIVLVTERDDWIVFRTVCWWDATGVWVPYPEMAIPAVGYLDRKRAMRQADANDDDFDEERVPIAIWGGRDESAIRDVREEIGAFLCFMNALQCANVRCDTRISSAKNEKAAAALEFDSYHILTIDTAKRGPTGELAVSGGGRSPREHLRRGHIRRYEQGLRIWVNATVVNPGVGGKLSKDYRVVA